MATDKANIDYDPSKVKLSQIKAAIEKAGYKPIEEVKNKVDVD
ncbi:cation transporter, partial [Clostridioides difficile]